MCAKTFQQLGIDYQKITNDSSADNSSLGTTLLNIAIRKILGLSDWAFNKDSVKIPTVTKVQEYSYPYNAQKIDYINVWYGGIWYVPDEVSNGRDWTILNQVIVYSSIPQKWNVDYDQKTVKLFPIPNDANGTIKMGFIKKVKDYGAANYSTGSISCASSGSIISGTSGASWGSAMEGRYIQFGATNTVNDGFWFEITSVLSSGSLVVRETIPSAVSATGTYTIAELCPFPDGFEDLPLYYALDQYYLRKQLLPLAQQYDGLYNSYLEDLMMRDSRSVKGLLEKQPKPSLYDPNANPWDITIK